MKNLLYILLFSTQMLLAQNFETGNELYRKGDYVAAITQYENIVRSNRESAELYFNLANAYYKLNKVGPAVYYYEKALLLNPDDRDIANNLLFAQKMQIDEVKAVPKMGFNKLISDFTSTFHYDLWAWISIGFAFIVLAFFIGYYFSASAIYKRAYFVGMFVALAPLVVSIAAAIHQKNGAVNDRPAIVFEPRVAVKSEPSADSADAFVLHEGTKVYVLESLDNYKKITIADGNEGWIDAGAIKELK